ncbi:MAG: TonB-dependent receptor plug domain-containing protein [Ferruginibacter sp.]
MKYSLFYLLLCFCFSATAQKNNALVITDAVSGEPLANASVKNITSDKTYMANNLGHVIINFKEPVTVEVSSVGYVTATFKIDLKTKVLSLTPTTNSMQAIVVTGNRTAQKRSEAPIAITTISKQTIEDTKAQRMDFLLNKVSGVFMVNLGNEQHEMSIRQPMTTKSLFLYMEDGIPIRTTGVYNHNALLEINLPSAKSIEVIKGPSSALYGAEAIGGVVNVITQSAPAFTGGQVSMQLNDKGYKRADAQIGTSFGKWGIIASGYYADKRNGPIEYSNFNKTALSVRADYRANDKTNWANTFSLVNYFSDMSGSIDSLKFAEHNYTSQQTFTYRKVYALRYKSMLTHNWNNNSNTSVALLFRNNSVGQNPSYTIGSTLNPTKFKGQINDNTFKSYALFVTHTQKFDWLKSKIIAGTSVEFSPQTYYAKYISINKDLALNKYTSYDGGAVDSFLSKYRTGILNMAAYADYEMSR